ncbi:hypothetical protein [Luteimonas cucumeris]|uniref:hypothetical protein n=1 Tax=Luteimonas cucumeris TaxID=985012 RepID=UPI00119DF48A|nr:hypothetical protein [Luteimonas cucumeris]
MNPQKLHRQVDIERSREFSQTQLALALENAENEGWRVSAAKLQGAAPLSNSERWHPRRLIRALSREFESWAGTRQLSLKQLHAELIASTFPDATHDLENRDLIALIREDLRDAVLWSEPEDMKPLSAWRARYNDIDRCLRNP